MKIVNLIHYQLAFFKVENTLHVTVSSLHNEKTIDVRKLHGDEFNKTIKNIFEGIFERQLASYTSKPAASLFDSTTQVLIIILR